METKSLEEQAWANEPPRSGQALSREETFIRMGLTWVGEWLRRNEQRLASGTAGPFAIILCEEAGISPQHDTYLAGKPIEELATGAYSYPVGASVVFVTPNISKARGVKQAFSDVQTLLNFLKQDELLDRHLIIVDPMQRAAGVHRAGSSIEDFATQVVVEAGNLGALTVTSLDVRLERIHRNCFARPRQPFRDDFWEGDPVHCKTVSLAEKVIQRVLMYTFFAEFGEDRVLCDEEVVVSSGRADIRLTIPKDGGLRLFWLELKVLRESDGPSGRKQHTMTCIDQARGRRNGALATTEATYACCYDASLAHVAFETDVIGHAANDPIVELRKYDVFNKLYGN